MGSKRLEQIEQAIRDAALGKKEALEALEMGARMKQAKGALDATLKQRKAWMSEEEMAAEKKARIEAELLRVRSAVGDIEQIAESMGVRLDELPGIGIMGRASAENLLYIDPVTKLAFTTEKPPVQVELSAKQLKSLAALSTTEARYPRHPSMEDVGTKFVDAGFGDAVIRKHGEKGFTRGVYILGENPAAESTKERPVVFWSSQVAREAGLPVSTITSLLDNDAFRKGLEYVVTPGGLRQFTKDGKDRVVAMARELHLKEGGRVRLEKAIDIVKRLREGGTDVRRENNRFGILKDWTEIHEMVLLQHGKRCLDMVGRAQELPQGIVEAVDGRWKELDAKARKDKLPAVTPERAMEIRQEVAALVRLMPSADLRRFGKTAREKLSGVGMVARWLQQAGQGLADKLADRVVDPKVEVTTERDGLITASNPRI